MKSIILLLKIVIICSLFTFAGCDIPSIEKDFVQNEKFKNNNNISNNNSKYYAKEGDVCKNYYIDLECEEGLECFIVAKKPIPTGFCHPPGYEVKEDDFIYGNQDEYNTYKNNITK